MNGGRKTLDKLLAMAWSDDPPSSIMRIPLNHKEGVKQRGLELNLKIMAQDYEGTDDLKGIWG